MGNLRKRIISLFVAMMLFLALCATGVLLATLQGVCKEDSILTETVGDNNSSAWDGSDMSGEVRFQLGASEDHVTMKYPTKIYLDKDESLGNAGYYFQIVSGHFGGSNGNRVYVNPHIWGYRHDNTNSYMDNVFSDYHYIARNGVTSDEVSSKTTSGVDNDTGMGIGTNHGQLLLNVYKYASDDSGYNIKIKLQGTPKNTGTYTYTFSNVNGMPVNNFIDTEQWSSSLFGGSWKNSGSYTNMSPSPIRIEINIYDKDALKNAINRLESMNRTSESDTILSNARNVLNNRKVTKSEVDNAITSVENEISRLENLSVELRNLYNDLNNKLTDIGVNSSTSGYKAIYDDLAVANTVINSSSPAISAINASINTLQYYSNIWDAYLADGRYKIIKGTFGDYYATFIYPSKISMEVGQNIANLGYSFIVDANYNPTDSDYRMFFDAGGWGNKADMINEYFNNYTYTAAHSIGGNATAGNWSFQNYESQTSVNGNWRFASVTYNSKPYLLVSAGNQSYKSTITPSGTASKIGKFTYTYEMRSLSEQWTSSTDWGSQQTIVYSDPVSIDFEIIGAGVTEAKENLRTAKSNLLDRLKNAAGKINNMSAITSLIDNINAMVDSETATADEINALTQSVTSYNIDVDRNWEVNTTYCIEREIFVNQYVDIDGNSYNYVIVDGVRKTGDSNGKIKLTANADSSDITVNYPDGTSFILKLNADHNGYKCEETSTCTVCGTALESREHNWTNETKINDANCINGAEYQYTCSYDSTHTKTEFKGERNPDNHDWSSWVSNNDATCEIDGTETRICQRDGCSNVENQIVENSKLNHNFGNYISNNDATCEADGTETGTCQREGCGKIDTRTVEGSKLGHDFGEWVYNNDATCETDGTETKSCRRSGCDKTETQTKVDSKLGHNWVNGEKLKDANCVHGAEYRYTCSNDETHTKTLFEGDVNPDNHSYGEEWTSNDDATCENDGTKYRDCQNGCGVKDTQTDIGSALGHDYELVETISEATCITQAKNKYVCKHDSSHIEERFEGELNPDNHSFGEWISNNDATCESDGTEYRECQHGCGEKQTQTDIDSALGHDYELTETISEATCTTQAKNRYVCKHDPSHIEERVEGELDPNNHSYGQVWTSNNDATCENDGTKYKECQYGCGTKDTQTDTGSALGHEFGDWTYNNDATCEADGTETRSCNRSGCDKTETQSKAGTKIDHVWEKGDKVNDANCMHGDEYKYTCTFNANHTKTEYEGEINPANHSFGEEWTSNNDATCESDGTKYRECQNGCGKKETQPDTGSALGHKYEFVETISVATCTTQAKNKYVCQHDPSHIEERVEGELDPNNHDFGNWTYNNDATCEADGTETGTCQREGCNVTDTRVAKDTKLNHEFGNWVSNNDATCEIDGTETRTCQRDGCDKTETRTVEGSKLDHEFGNWVSNNDATCETDGTETGTCLRDGCNKTYTRTVENSKLGHRWVKGEKVNDASCVHGAEYRYTCSNDETHTKTQFEGDVNPTNHSFGEEWTSNNDATCETDGTEYRECLNGCLARETQTDIGSALGHDYKLTETISVATCTTQAKNKYVCQHDPSHIEERVEGELDPNNHNLQEIDKVDANCTENGHIDYKCQDCGHETSVVIDALGHDWDDGVVTIQPTETEKGEKTYTCKVCGETRTEEIPALGVAEKPEQNGEEKEPATMNVGAVVGGAVGGTAGVGIIVVIILVIIKKKKVM